MQFFVFISSYMYRYLKYYTLLEVKLKFKLKPNHIYSLVKKFLERLKLDLSKIMKKSICICIMQENFDIVKLLESRYFKM